MSPSANDARSVTVRRVGGSLMMTLPRHAVESLDLREGTRVAYEIRDGLLVLDPSRPVRPRYRLADLIARCDLEAPTDPGEREWLDVPEVGKEATP
jgi:antitoxin ChpS